jgi:NAD(P)-dependent dehydrogenase (short-subunit alcohol dehydrogenase family)
MEIRVAIVTGASSGIGEALSRDLVSRGWTVAMADVRPNIEPSGELVKCEVADYDSQA